MFDRNTGPNYKARTEKAWLEVGEAAAAAGYVRFAGKTAPAPQRHLADKAKCRAQKIYRVLATGGERGIEWEEVC